MFLNRQTLYLRPDLNPTDKRRANHILGRVLGLEPAAVTAIEGRARNLRWSSQELLDIFEAPAVEMEEALEPQAILSKTQRYLVGSYFLHEYSFETSAKSGAPAVAGNWQFIAESGAIRSSTPDFCLIGKAYPC